MSDIFIPNHIELCSIVAAHKDQENSGGGGGGGGGDGGDGGGKEEKGGKGGKGGVVGTIDGSDDEVGRRRKILCLLAHQMNGT